jgi:predicted nucleic acid-binding Zn ribbon protein
LAEERRRINNVAIVVILVLAILWAAVLLPPLLRARNEGGGGGGLGELLASFHSAFDRFRPVQDLPPMQPLVGPVGPVGTVGPVRPSGGMNSNQRRRRDILIGLLLAAGITLVMAVFSGGTILFVALHVIVDISLGAYVFLLLQLKSRQDVRRSAPRPLTTTGRHLRPVPTFPDATPLAEPAFALRRTATY